MRKIVVPSRYPLEHECYDLATADFVPLMLKTPHSARQLIDWILQAKLCVYFGDAVKNLRQQGVRTVCDLAYLTPQELEALTAETALTKSALAHAQQSVRIALRFSQPILLGICRVRDDIARG